MGSFELNHNGIGSKSPLYSPKALGMNFSEGLKQGTEKIEGFHFRSPRNIDINRSASEIYSLPPRGSLSFDVEREHHTSLYKILHAVAPCIFKRKDFYGEGLSLHHSLITTRRRFKPWPLLTPEERKEKIQYLWLQTRRYFW